MELRYLPISNDCAYMNVAEELVPCKLSIFSNQIKPYRKTLLKS